MATAVMTGSFASMLNKPLPWSHGGVGWLQRKCACGQPSKDGGECTECAARHVQKKLRGGAGVSAAPPVVARVVSSPGTSLESATRLSMEQHFGHDFSAVRVHTDAQAAQSAESVEALAYTVGTNLVFGRGQYAPATSAGQHLLAHELTHVLQQTAGAGGSFDTRAAESEADAMADSLSRPRAGPIHASVGGGVLLRQAKKTPGVDAAAQAIIDAAKDSASTPDKGKRATDLVWAILRTYYPSEVGKVKEVVYDQGDPGLTTEPLTSTGRIGKPCSDNSRGQGASNTQLPTGANLQVKFCVGDSYLDQVDGFARRVLQLGHELQHADQQRAGLGGPSNKNKREFQAYAWEALQAEKAGTGKLPNSTRLTLIDCALGILLCMSEADQRANDATKSQLLAKRTEVNGKAGNAPTDPPSSCGQHPPGCSGDFRAAATSGQSTGK